MTAVEWLVEELQKAEYIPKDSLIMDYVIKLSKEMEKQQIIDAMDVCQRTDFYVKYECSEDYYKETFKNN